MLNKPAPMEAHIFNTDDQDLIEKHEKNLHWKIKGVLSKLSYRIFSRYSTKDFSQSDSESYFK
jgi:hypothetical protein